MAEGYRTNDTGIEEFFLKIAYNYCKQYQRFYNYHNPAKLSRSTLLRAAMNLALPPTAAPTSAKSSAVPSIFAYLNGRTSWTQFLAFIVALVLAVAALFLLVSADNQVENAVTIPTSEEALIEDAQSLIRNRSEISRDTPLYYHVEAAQREHALFAALENLAARQQ